MNKILQSGSLSAFMLALLIIFAPAQVPGLYADEPYTGGTPAGRSSGRAIFPDYNNSTRQPEGVDPLPPTLRPKNSAGYPPGSENGNGENLPGGGLAPGSLNAPRNDRSEWGYDLDKSKNLPVVSTQPLNKEDTPAESATAPGEEPNIYVDSVIYNEELIEAGRTQIIQINLANRRKLTGSHEMRLRITKPDGKNEYLSFRNVRVTGRTVEPVIYRYPSDKTLEGEYRTQVSLHRNGEPRPLYVYDSPFIFNAYLREGVKGARTPDLAADIPDDIYAIFNAPDSTQEGNLPSGAVDGAEPGSVIGVSGAGGQLPGNGQTSADGNKLLPDAAGADELQGAGTGVSASNQTQGAQGGNTRAGAAGTPGSRTAVSGGRTAGGTQTTRLNPNNVIDLEWKDLKISNSNILRGESTSGYVYLTNNSAHIAENVTYTFYLAPELLKDNYSQSTQILTGSYPFVAPGETKLIQIPIDIKQDVLPGTYVVIGEIDPFNTLPELNRRNNIKASEPIYFSEIALIAPDNNISVNSGSDITFSWRSGLYVQFYVQISPNQSFNEEDKILQLPGGDPTPLTSITTLRGEVENLRSQSADKNNNEYYWRVIGFDTKKNRAVSITRKFFFNPQN